MQHMILVILRNFMNRRIDYKQNRHSHHIYFILIYLLTKGVDRNPWRRAAVPWSSICAPLGWHYSVSHHCAIQLFSVTVLYECLCHFLTPPSVSLLSVIICVTVQQHCSGSHHCPNFFFFFFSTTPKNTPEVLTNKMLGRGK